MRDRVNIESPLRCRVRRMPLLGRVLVTLGPLVVIAAPTPGQTSPTPFVSSTDVRLVTIQVRASSAGAPVLDLTREELTLLEDGRPVEIAHFERVSPGRPGGVGEQASSPGEAAEQPGAAPLHLTLFLDNVHLAPGTRARALVEVRRFLVERLPAEALVSLVSLDPGLHVRVPFTKNVRRVLDALESLGLFSAQGMSATLERQQVLLDIRDHLRHTIERPSPGDPPCCNHLGDFAHHYAGTEFQRAQNSLAALGTYIGSLASQPGRKAVVHVSDGLPLIAGLPAFLLANRLCDGSGAMQGEQWALDVGLSTPLAGGIYNPRAASLDTMRYSSRPLLDAVAAAANAHGVVLHMLQASGPGRSDFASASSEGRGTDMTGLSVASANHQDVLFALADETGGRAIFDQALHRGLDGTAEDLGSYYVLGFYPQRSGDDRVRRLEVKSRRQGVDLRYARSYRDTAPDTNVAEAVLGALLQGVERADFPLQLQSSMAPAVPGSARQALLQIRIALDRLALVDQGTTRHGSFTVFVGVRRQNGSILRVRQKTVPVTVGPGSSTAYLYEVRLDLPPGEHVAAAAVRDDLGGTLAIQRTKVSVAEKR